MRMKLWMLKKTEGNYNVISYAFMPQFIFELFTLVSYAVANECDCFDLQYYRSCRHECTE